ncbi:MAG TPA: hypothetical protein VGK94_08375 [Candidatus Polarisedimenticolia bacterium]
MSLRHGRELLVQVRVVVIDALIFEARWFNDPRFGSLNLLSPRPALRRRLDQLSGLALESQPEIKGKHCL